MQSHTHRGGWEGEGGYGTVLPDSVSWVAVAVGWLLPVPASS